MLSNDKEFEYYKLTSYCTVICEAMVCQVGPTNQYMKVLRCMVHTFPIDLIIVPYSHLKHYMAIHDNLDNKFFVRFPLGDQLQLFDPCWCALPNRVKDIDLDL